MAKQDWITLIETTIITDPCCECQDQDFFRLLQHINNFFDAAQVTEFAQFVADEETEDE